MRKIRQGHSVPSDDETGTKLTQTLTRSLWFSRVPLLLSGYNLFHPYSQWLSCAPFLLSVAFSFSSLTLCYQFPVSTLIFCGFPVFHSYLCGFPFSALTLCGFPVFISYDVWLSRFHCYSLWLSRFPLLLSNFPFCSLTLCGFSIFLSYSLWLSTHFSFPSGHRAL